MNVSVECPRSDNTTERPESNDIVTIHPQHGMTPQPQLILEIVVRRRPLALGHALLLPVHLGHLPAAGRLVHLLVIADLDEPREPQADALLAAGIHPLLHARLVPRAERQVRRLDLPDILGLEPDVGLVLPAGAVRVKRLGPVDDDLGERGVQLLEHGLAEPRANVAHCLVRVRARVVAGQQERAVDGCALALAVVRAEDDQVERVADAREVVFLDLTGTLVVR